MKRIARFLKKYDDLVFLILFYGVFHFLCSPDYWDDASYSRLIASVDNNVFEYLRRMYLMQTSRMGIEAVAAIVCMMPHIVWRIADLLMIVLLYQDLKWFAEAVFKLEFDKRHRWILSLLLCAYPFATMACTGWKVTTMNYLWVAALGLYAANKILKAVLGEEKLSPRESLFLVLAVIYSASFESLAPVMLLGLAAACIDMRRVKRKRIPGAFAASIVCILALLILVVLCPGNQNRLADDIAAWMPEFGQLHLLDKLRMGIVTAFMHFVSIPSPIFFLFNTVCLAGVWIKDKCVWKRLAAACPLAINVIWTGYYLAQYLLGWKVFTYQVPSPLLTSGREMWEQLGLLVCTVLWMGTMLYSIHVILEDRKKFLICLTILLTGCVPEVVVGMSPTVVNSMLRTVLYLYVAMILILMCTWDESFRQMKKQAVFMRFFYAALTAGVILNALQLIRHILIYG